MANVEPQNVYQYRMEKPIASQPARLTLAVNTHTHAEHVMMHMLAPVSLGECAQTRHKMPCSDNGLAI